VYKFQHLAMLRFLYPTAHALLAVLFQVSYFFFAGVAVLAGALAGDAFAGDFLGAFLTSFFGDFSLAILNQSS
jgi:hypothetical protein